MAIQLLMAGWGPGDPGQFSKGTERYAFGCNSVYEMMLTVDMHEK